MTVGHITINEGRIPQCGMPVLGLIAVHVRWGTSRVIVCFVALTGTWCDSWPRRLAIVMTMLCMRAQA